MKNIFVIFLLLLLNSCATVQEQLKTKSTEKPSETFIESFPEKKPDWVYKVPPELQGNLFFVGLSDKFSTEKEARENAERNVISQVVRYIVIDVKDKFQRIQTSYGLSTDIIDPTIATRQVEQQSSEALARRVKSSEWYIEKWQRIYPNKPAEIFYITYVLAFVTKDEVDRAINEQLKYHEELSKSAKLAQEKLSNANGFIIDADQIKASQPIQAFGKYRKAIKLTEEAKSEIQFYPEIKGIADNAEKIISTAKQKEDELVKNPETRLMVALFSLATKSIKKPLTVAVAKINYQETELSSKLSEYLIGYIEELLSKGQELYRVIPERIFRKELSKNKLSIDDCLIAKAKETAILAQIEGLIFGRYWEKEDNIELRLELLQVSPSGMKISSESTELPKSIFHKDISFRPDSNSLAFLDLFGSTIENKEFQIKVWPDKGENAVYKDGEKVVFYFRANKDCYAYLYHKDAQGNVKQLFPNNFNSDNFVKANQVYSIPSEAMNFDFKITAPYGTEIIKAVASLQPIKGIETSADSDVFRNLGKVSGSEVDTKNIDSVARAIELVPKTARTEFLTSLTTVKE